MKKSIVMITIFIMTTSLAYSHNFVMSLYVPFAGSRPSFYQNGILSEYLTDQAESAFEVAVIFQPSIYFQLDKFHYIVLGIDFGWYRDTFKFHDNSQDFTHEFDTVMTGLNFRWNPMLFVLGIGGGVKIPFTGKYWEGNNNIALSAGNFSARFNNTIIPYVRLYTGIDLFLVSLALYVNFDIPYYEIKNNLSSLGEGYSYPGKLGSVDVGVQLGIHLDIFKFGEEAEEEAYTYY